MKSFKWKRTKRDDKYGDWYKLELGFQHYGGIWIGAPQCLKELHLKNIGRLDIATHPDEEFVKYINALYPNHENGCPQTSDCGWTIDFSSFGWNEPLDDQFDLRRCIKNTDPIVIHSFEEAREVAETRIMKHIEWFTKQLLEAKNPK